MPLPLLFALLSPPAAAASAPLGPSPPPAARCCRSGFRFAVAGGGISRGYLLYSTAAAPLPLGGWEDLLSATLLRGRLWNAGCCGCGCFAGGGVPAHPSPTAEQQEMIDHSAGGQNSGHSKCRRATTDNEHLHFLTCSNPTLRAQRHDKQRW